MYVLKKGQPPIEVVDGPMTGRSYFPGMEYSQIPDEERRRFEKKKNVPAKPVTTKNKEGSDA